MSVTNGKLSPTFSDGRVHSGLKSQRQFFESEWGPHDADFHPAKLKLHVERRAKNAQVLNFREMCGESAFIAEADLTFIKKIGSGSFATVEIAKYHPSGQEEKIVAVKRLKSHAAVEITHFASEANLLRKLHHPFIVNFIGVGSSEESKLVNKQSKSSCYMVQEFMNGGNLKQKIFKQANTLHPIYSDHDAIQWGKQIAEGLAYLHSANPLVLHRDLKLENILLNEVPKQENERPQIIAKICDFGLAVSLLDPHFSYRQADTIPAGLASPRIDSNFHQQMALDVKGDAILDRKLAEQAEKLKNALNSNPGSPKPQPRAKSFPRGDLRVVQEQKRKDLPPQIDEESPEDLRRYSVSVAEVAHGRIQPPSSKPKPVQRGWQSQAIVRFETGERHDQEGIVKIILNDLQTKTMSKTGQGILVSKNEEHPVHEAYHLTGRAGSFLYMAPEVIMCQPYNEKADVFSLGIILYELFLRKTLAAVVLELDDNPGSVEMYAYQVAGGYRQPIPLDWPQELRVLINQCWLQNPELRPHTADVAKRLLTLENSDLFRKWETEHSGKALTKCCCIQ